MVDRVRHRHGVVGGGGHGRRPRDEEDEGDHDRRLHGEEDARRRGEEDAGVGFLGLVPLVGQVFQSGQTG